MTALGAVVVWRAYFACKACPLGGYFADAWLGIEGLLTRGATRLVCRLGGRGSFAEAERLLSECWAWKVGDETIRRARQAEATKIREFRAQSPTIAQAFAAAEGNVEFQADAAKVNTTEGWRDMKVGNFAHREPGETATPAERDQRHLPAPTTRAALQFGDGPRILGIYHAAEHIADAGKGLFGEGTGEAAARLEDGRGLLLSDGWAGLCDHIGATLVKSPELAGHAALGELTGYFAVHTGRLNYGHRLYTGQSIGSGMVEGAAKELVGRRLKQTGARWGVEDVNRMAELCCLTYSDHWGLYRASPN